LSGNGASIVELVWYIAAFTEVHFIGGLSLECPVCREISVSNATFKVAPESAKKSVHPALSWLAIHTTGSFRTRTRTQ
jgi:hypothetical protein